MGSLDPWGWWRRFTELPADGMAKTLIGAIVGSRGAAIVGSIAAVSLRPLQNANLERERQAQMAAMVSRAIGNQGPLHAHVVTLAVGKIAPALDPVTFDQRAAAQKPDTSIAIPKAVDIAGLGRLEARP